VTIKNLLEMKSGMVVDGTLWTPSIWSFLSNYLTQGLVGTPGVTEAYSNTDFTILQAIIALLVDPVQQGGDGIAPYVSYVTDHILKPMVIDPGVFNPTPDAASTASGAISVTRIGFAASSAASVRIYKLSSITSAALCHHAQALDLRCYFCYSHWVRC
jgi:CubicO group peptidase (beta-lactamase class C family)